MQLAAIAVISFLGCFCIFITWLVLAGVCKKLSDVEKKTKDLDSAVLGALRLITAVRDTPRQQVYEVPKQLVEELKNDVLREIYKSTN